MRSAPVEFDVIEDKKRRPQNAFWSAFDRVLAYDLHGKRVLVPGCGFGEDAIRVARLGAEVEAIDLSPDVITLARNRVAEFGYRGVKFTVSPVEALPCPDASFDLCFIVDILHHVDIPLAIGEMKRVLKPGGRIIGNELYTHSFLQKRVRESWLVDKVLYGPMRKLIYGEGAPYITADERKIDEMEFALVERACSEFEARWFNGFVGRLAPDRLPFVESIDRAGMRMLGRAGRYFAGRVVFEGVVNKSDGEQRASQR